MNPVIEFDFIIIFLDVIYIYPFMPRENNIVNTGFFVEVIFHMAVSTHSSTFIRSVGSAKAFIDIIQCT